MKATHLQVSWLWWAPLQSLSPHYSEESIEQLSVSIANQGKPGSCALQGHLGILISSRHVSAIRNLWGQHEEAGFVLFVMLNSPKDTGNEGWCWIGHAEREDSRIFLIFNGHHHLIQAHWTHHLLSRDEQSSAVSVGLVLVTPSIE